MAMNRKAVFFTLSAILILSLLVFAFRSQSYVTLVNRVPVVETRILVANDFIKDLEGSYTERALVTSGRSALRAYIINVTGEGSFNDSAHELNQRFTELLVSGTLDETGPHIDIEKTLNSRMSDMVALANDTLRIETHFSIGDAELFQARETGPWRVGIKIEMNFTANATVSYWNTSKNITASIGILGFNDSYIAINTMVPGPSVCREVVRAEIDFWNLSSISNFIDGTAYLHDNRSPSFLSRLVNDTSMSTCCGIQSLINSSASFKKNGGILGGFRNLTFVDSCYFSAIPSCSDVYEIVGITSDIDSISPNDFSFPFRINPYHYTKYNLSSLNGTQIYQD